MEAIKFMQRYWNDEIEVARQRIATAERALAVLALEALGRED